MFEQVGRLNVGIDLVRRAVESVNPRATNDFGIEHLFIL